MDETVTADAEVMEDVEGKYLNSLYLELNELKVSEKVNQHKQRKLLALITMIKNR